jgi:hypothetical protein
VTKLQEQYEDVAADYERTDGLKGSGRECMCDVTEHLDELDDAFAKAGSACIQVRQRLLVRVHASLRILINHCCMYTD